MAVVRTALASVVSESEGRPVVQELRWPDLAPGGMIAKVEAATLCGTDVHIWKGVGTSGATLPYIPGHETTGTVVEIAGSRSDVYGDPLRVGDRIIWTYPFCGECYFCRVLGEPTLCRNAIRFGRGPSDKFPYLLGGCATHTYVPPLSGVVRVPDGVPADLAASAACALRTVVHGFERLGPVAPREVCLVQGCGPVGLYATAMAARAFRKVLVIGAPVERLVVAREFGATATLDLNEVESETDRREWAYDAIGGHGADVVIQCATTAAVPEGLQLVRDGGRYLSIGGGRGPITVEATALGRRMLTITGVRSGHARHFVGAIEFLARSALPLSRLISGRYSLKNVGKALEEMAALREIKPVVIPSTE